MNQCFVINTWSLALSAVVLPLEALAELETRRRAAFERRQRPRSWGLDATWMQPARSFSIIYMASGAIWVAAVAVLPTAA